MCLCIWNVDQIVKKGGKIQVLEIEKQGEKPRKKKRDMVNKNLKLPWLVLVMYLMYLFIYQENVL